MNYPHCEYVDFIDDKNLIIENEICGERYSDKKHDDIVIKSIIKYQFLNDKYINKDDDIYVFQHGDFQRINILWLDMNKFICIDLDDIGYYPILYDLIKYLYSAKYTKKEIINILNENKTSIVNIYKKCGIINNEDYLIDKIIKDYLYCGKHEIIASIE